MNGIITVDKPMGMTSHDVVLFMRRRFRIKKVGHAGTLDPLATGVLVLLLGKATKLSGDLVSVDKEYEAVLRLGIKTQTGDSEGKVMSTRALEHLSEEAINDAFHSFRGAIDQIPPMVSALKHKGRKLYEFARRGQEVERKPRRVVIYDIIVNEINMPDVKFFVRCSKGTYIRKLAEDIGEKLGCGAHITALRRVKSGRYSIDDALAFERLRALNIDELEKCLGKI